MSGTSPYPIRYGFHPVRELLRHRPTVVRRVLIGDSRRGARPQEISDLCRQADIPCSEVPNGELDRLTRGVHNGFVAELVAPGDVTPARDSDLVVLVEDVQDPRNLGALLRVCEAVGVGRVLIRDRGTSRVTATVVKASAGAAEALPLDRVVNSAAILAEMKQEGYWVYGAAMEGARPWKVDLTGRLVLCIGGEEKGLRRRTRQHCDGLIGLPMHGCVQSLNLSTAAAAILYEALRQRSLRAEGGEDAPG